MAPNLGESRESWVSRRTVLILGIVTFLLALSVAKDILKALLIGLTLNTAYPGLLTSLRLRRRMSGVDFVILDRRSSTYRSGTPPATSLTFLVSTSTYAVSRHSPVRRSGYALIAVMTLYFPSLCRKGSAVWTLAASMGALGCWFLLPRAWCDFLHHPIYLVLPTSVVAFFRVSVSDRRPLRSSQGGEDEQKNRD